MKLPDFFYKVKTKELQQKPSFTIKIMNDRQNVSTLTP